METQKIIEDVMKLGERFLEADQETGNPALDNPGEMPETLESSYEDVEANIKMIANGCENALIAIGQIMNKGLLDKAVELYGAEAEEILNQLTDVMLKASEVFEEKQEEEEAEEDEESEEEEENPEEEAEEDAEAEAEEEADEESEEESESEEEGEEEEPSEK